MAFFVFSGTASSWIFNISASLMVAKRVFTPAILFCLDHVVFTLLGVNIAQLLWDSEPTLFVSRKKCYATCNLHLSGTVAAMPSQNRIHSIAMKM